MIFASCLLLLLLCGLAAGGGDICKLCKCFERSNQLHVDCSYKELTYIPANIPNETKHLFLQGNQLTEIGYNNTFGNYYLRNLRHLYLQNNPITKLNENAFHNVRHISTLLLHFTLLSTIPPNTFSELTHLRYLWLNNAALTTLDDNIFIHLNRLQELYLQNNQLVNLNNVNFSGLHAIHHLYTHGNKNLPDPTCCSLCGVPANVDIKWGVVPFQEHLTCGCTGAVNCVDANGNSYVCNDNNNNNNNPHCYSYIFNSANKRAVQPTVLIFLSTIIVAIYSYMY